MPSNRSNSRGKWLAGMLVAIGLIAALAGLKFRVFTPAPGPTTLPALSR